MDDISIALFLNNKFNLFVYFSVIIFLNIIASYFFDTGKLKSKDFWDVNLEKAGDKLKDLNKNSYSVALSAAAFIWAFIIHIPIIVLIYYFNISIEWYKLALSLFINFIFHRMIDNDFTNKKTTGFYGEQWGYFLLCTWTGFIWTMLLSK